MNTIIIRGITHQIENEILTATLQDSDKMKSKKISAKIIRELSVIPNNRKRTLGVYQFADGTFSNTWYNNK